MVRTYPNLLGDYESTYSWGGRLFTTKADDASSTFCSDSPGETVTLKSHPDFNDWWSTYRTLSPDTSTTTTTTLDPIYADPRGLNWGCVQETGDFGAQQAFLSTSFSGEAAIFTCDQSIAGPVGAEGTAAFLTASSISYEGDDGATTTEPDGEGPTTPATAHIETSVPVEAPTPSPTGDDVTSSAHIETSEAVEPPTTTDAQPSAHTEISTILNQPTPTDDGTTSSAHTEISTSLNAPTVTVAPTAHIETSATLKPPTGSDTEVGTVVNPPNPPDVTSTAHTEESTDVEPPVTSAPGFAHTEDSANPVPPSTTSDKTLYTAHTELPQSLGEPSKPVTVIPPSEVGTVVQPGPGTTSNAGGVGGVIGSLIESYISTGGSLPTNVPAQPQQGSGNNPPAGTQAPPTTYIPVGTTSVAVVPTSIPTVIAGTSTNVPAVVVGSQTVAAGQTVVVDNTPISVPTANSQAPSNGQPQQNGQENNQLQGQSQAPAVIIGGSSTVVLPTAAAAPSPAPPALTIGDQTIQPSGTAYVISGQTVSPGSPITLGAGPSATVVALTTNAAGSSIVVVGSSTIPFAAAPAPTAAPALTLGGQTIQPSGSAYVIAGQTLLPDGAPITVAGTTLALTTDAAGNTLLASNGVTQTLAAVQTTPSPLVIYGSTVQPTDGTAYVWNGQTLSLGGSITVGGSTTLQLTTNAQGQTVVVQQIGGGSAAKTTATSGLGGLINSGLGGSGSATQTVLSGSGSGSGSATGAAAASSSTGAAAVVGRVESGILGAVLGVLVAVV
ncbi:hypothetical protein SLS57_008950 [Botryosphaeria dothidea]